MSTEVEDQVTDLVTDETAEGADSSEETQDSVTDQLPGIADDLEVSAAELLEEIRAKQGEIDDANRVLLSLEEETKEAKAQWEQRVAELGCLIRRRDEKLPLFDKKSLAAADEPGDESWRLVDIDQLALGSSLTEKLREAGINTIGELEDQRAIGLTEIKGIGQAKVTKIEEHVVDWLTRNRDADVFDGGEEQEATEE